MKLLVPPPTLLLSVVLVLAPCATGSARAQVQAPATIVWHGDWLQAVRQCAGKGDARLAPALARLDADTRKAKAAGPFTLAQMGRHVGVDLWAIDAGTPAASAGDRTPLRAALDYLVPFAQGEAKWTREQIGGFEPSELRPLLRQAALAWPSGGDERVDALLAPPSDGSRFVLTWPSAALLSAECAAR